jgi:hypothetical protein
MISLQALIPKRRILKEKTAQGEPERPFLQRASLVGIRKAPHAGWPELARPTSLKFTYRNRAIGTGVSKVSPIEASSFEVGLVI